MAINNQIIGGNFTDPSGAPLALGYLILQLNQDEQSPTPGQIGASRKIQISLDSTGNVPSNPPVYIFANDSLNPANSYYRVWAYAANGQPVWGPQIQQVLSSPSPFNLSSWVPNSINTTSIPAPTPQLQTNEVANGSQTLLDLHAGTGVALTDNGAGRVTISTGGGGSTITGVSAVEVAGGGAGPSTLALNLSTEGTNDWIAQSGQSTATQIAIETPTGWNWKLNGTSRGRFRFFVINPNESPAGTGNAANATASPLLLSANAGDMRVPFIASPQRTVTYYAPNLAATLGVGTGVEIFGDGQLHTYKIYAFFDRKLTCQITAHASDGSVADVSLVATETVNQGAIYAFSFQCKIALGNSVVFQAVCTAVNGGDTFAAVGIQAITVF